jgi:hypothetical protein
MFIPYVFYSFWGWSVLWDNSEAEVFNMETGVGHLCAETAVSTPLSTLGSPGSALRLQQCAKVNFIMQWCVTIPLVVVVPVCLAKCLSGNNEDGFLLGVCFGGCLQILVMAATFGLWVWEIVELARTTGDCLPLGGNATAFALGEEEGLKISSTMVWVVALVQCIFTGLSLNAQTQAREE